MSDKNSQKNEQLEAWIYENITKRKTVNYRRTSYGLKHEAERALGRYVSNDEMKAAMMRCGFTPHDETALNPSYRIYVRR